MHDNIYCSIQEPPSNITAGEIKRNEGENGLIQSHILFTLGIIYFIWSISLMLLITAYSGITRSMSWLLMPWLLVLSGHQQPWYWINTMQACLATLRNDLKNLNIVICEKWLKNGNIFLFPKLTSAWKELVIPCHAMIRHAHSYASQATHVPVLDFPMSTTCMSLTLQRGSNILLNNRLQYWDPFHYKDNLSMYGVSFIMIRQASNCCFYDRNFFTGMMVSTYENTPLGALHKIISLFMLAI